MGEGGGAGELAGARPSPTLQLLNSAANLLCGHISMPVMYICTYNTLIHHTPKFSTHSVVFQVMPDNGMVLINVQIHLQTGSKK